MVALDMNAYRKLGAGSIYVDPLAVNRLLQSDALSMALPGSNMKRVDFVNAAEGYRFYVQRYYDGERTTIGESKETLLDTLICLLRYNGDVVTQGDEECVRVDGCPNSECSSNQADSSGKKPAPITFYVPLGDRTTRCPECDGMVLVVDAIRIGEAFVESGSNAETYGRTMLASEHLLVAHWIRHYRENHLQLLSQLGFVLDGPLSISGESAKLHTPMLMLIHDANRDLAREGMDAVLVMGLTKTGMTVDHFANLHWPLPEQDKAEELRDFAFAITDEYRYKYITPRPRATNRAFGSETYYGQDIFVRTGRGHEFVISLPYPTRTKNDATFSQLFEVAQYSTAGRAFELIRTLESDLYTNALVPVILAHEYASISLVPGGKVLDLATARAMRK